MKTLLLIAKTRAFYAYALFCSKSNEVPKQNLLKMINEQTDPDKLFDIEELNLKSIEKINKKAV